METPDLLRSREIGFIPFQGSMIRHRSLKNREDLGRFVGEIVPRHLYHSVAYYEKPTIRSMKDKIWKGAELIFDLDADHLEGAAKMTYEQILAEVKVHTLRLVERFLMDFLGIDPSMIKIYFSGGRGYHVHVQSEAIYSMDSNARREISNLVRGEGISLDQLVSATSSHMHVGGWFALMDQRLTSFYSSLKGSGTQSQTSNYLPGGKSGAEYFESLEKTKVFLGSEKKKIDILSEPGQIKYKSFNGTDRAVAEKILSEILKENKCEIDEPVTTDVHRLIRFPDSLHGKTGLRVMRIPFNDLGTYEPLSSAIPEIFLEGELKIATSRKLSIAMNGERFELDGEATVPTYAAIFAVAIGGANFC